MATAAKFLLKRESNKGNMSFSSTGTLTDRFSLFATFLKLKGIGRLERVTEQDAIEYGKQLALKVKRGDLSAAYVQNLVSAINTVFHMLRHDKWVTVSPTKDCGIPKRRLVRVEPTVSSEKAVHAITSLQTGNEAISLIAALALRLGLRSKEASLLDVRAAYQEVTKTGKLTIKKGTKGGRKRVVENLSDEQINTLKTAAEYQSTRRSLMPSDTNWKSWRENQLRHGREILHGFNIRGYHEFRAEFSAAKYKGMTGWDAPVNGGVILDKVLDESARKSIAQDLGHNRTDVVSAYIGSRR